MQFFLIGDRGIIRIDQGGTFHAMDCAYGAAYSPLWRFGRIWAKIQAHTVRTLAGEYRALVVDVAGSMACSV